MRDLSTQASGSVKYRFVCVFVPLAVIILLISWGFVYFRNVNLNQEVFRQQEAYAQRLNAEYLNLQIDRIIADLYILAHHEFLKNYDDRDPSRLADEFYLYSKYSGIYDQIRVINKSGMEVVRLNLRGHEPELVPEDQLQDKSDRYYFKDTIQLDAGEVYMSQFDLNIEQGEIETPWKPMIRFGTPLFGENGEKKGVLVLNYLGRDLLDTFKRLTVRSPGQQMFLNQDGYFLKGMTTEDEWGFMMDSRKDKTVQQRWPDVWETMLRQDEGQFMTRDGLFTFYKIYPLRRQADSLNDLSGGDRAHSLQSTERFWVVASVISPSQMISGQKRLIMTLSVLDLLLLALLGSISWRLIAAREKTRQAQQSLRALNAELEDKVDERTRWLSQTNKALKKEIVAHDRDVQEKEKIERYFRQAQKMEAIGNLAGGVAHDFNNILTPILGHADLALLELDEEDHLRFEIQQILDAGLRARDLVKQILSISSKTESTLGPVKVQTVLKEVVKLLRATIPSTIEFKTDLQSDCRPVLADPVQIHQVLMNLCTNAAQAMNQQHGALSLFLHETTIGPDDLKTHFNLPTGDYLRMEISDTGCGMEATVLEHIFDPYYTTKEKGQGTGLGLSTVHAIVQSLHGHISVYSDPGRGTTFRIYLPIVETEEAPAAVSESTPIPHGTEHLLAVDDETSVIQFEKMVLEHLGYTVTTAHDGEEALEIFKKHADEFDLLVSDVTMPKMTGVELIHKIWEEHPGFPAIICTGYSEIISPEEAEEMGIKKYLTKPVTVEMLGRAVREVLDG